MYYFMIGFNVGVVMTLLTLADFNWARFKFLCKWFVHLVEHE